MVVYCKNRTKHNSSFYGKIAGLLMLNLARHACG